MHGYHYNTLSIQCSQYLNEFILNEFNICMFFQILEMNNDEELNDDDGRQSNSPNKKRFRESDKE